MRRTYIIVLEYASESIEDERLGVLKMLESIGYTLELSEHAFLLASSDSTTVVRDAIKGSPFDIERIFVSEISSPAAWRNLVAQNNDIKSFLRNEH